MRIYELLEDCYYLPESELAKMSQEEIAFLIEAGWLKKGLKGAALAGAMAAGTTGGAHAAMDANHFDYLNGGAHPSAAQEVPSGFSHKGKSNTGNSSGSSVSKVQGNSAAAQESDVISTAGLSIYKHKGLNSLEKVQSVGIKWINHPENAGIVKGLETAFSGDINSPLSDNQIKFIKSISGDKLGKPTAFINGKIRQKKGNYAGAREMFAQSIEHVAYVKEKNGTMKVAVRLPGFSNFIAMEDGKLTDGIKSQGAVGGGSVAAVGDNEREKNSGPVVGSNVSDSKFKKVVDIPSSAKFKYHAGTYDSSDLPSACLEFKGSNKKDNAIMIAFWGEKGTISMGYQSDNGNAKTMTVYVDGNKVGRSKMEHNDMNSVDEARFNMSTINALQKGSKAEIHLDNYKKIKFDLNGSATAINNAFKQSEKYSSGDLQEETISIPKDKKWGFSRPRSGQITGAELKGNGVGIGLEFNGGKSGMTMDMNVWGDKIGKKEGRAVTVLVDGKNVGYGTFKDLGFGTYAELPIKVANAMRNGNSAEIYISGGDGLKIEFGLKGSAKALDAAWKARR